jgi:tRNA acetyltransferase TAN1
MVPVSGSCVTNLPEIQALCHTIFTPFFSLHPDRKFSVSEEVTTLSVH